METTKKVFYVDDDEDDIVIFGEICNRLSVDVNLYLNGLGLLDVLHSQKEIPSIIFVDINMPIISGYDVIKKIKSFEHTKHIPIVVLSTATDLLTIRKSKQLGANYYIAKPTTIHKLFKAIESTLEIDWQTFTPSEGEFIYKYD